LPSRSTALDLFEKTKAKDMEHAKLVVAPAIAYFKEKFGDIVRCEGGELSNVVKLLKCARLVNPFRACELVDDLAGCLPLVDELVSTTLVGDEYLSTFPLLSKNRERLNSLKAELPEYIRRVQDLRGHESDALTVEEKSKEISAWWAKHASELPVWAELARDIFLLSPSSAAIERLFSILRYTFGDDQKTAKEDYVETACMLQFNSRPGAHS
jgi:hypothetical protein